MGKTRLYIAALILGVMSATVACAGVEDGQKIYLKACKSCHGNGVKGAAMATQNGWDKWFEKDAVALVEKHKSDAKSAAYFGGPSFKNQMQDLHEFLKEYGSDSGNVPACG